MIDSKATLLLRHGTSAEHATYTGPANEVTVDTDKKTVVVHDGTTVGGFPLARATALTGNLDNVARIGIGGAADATNKLAVNSSAVLFNNVGAGIQVKVNKNATGDTGSFLFQKAFSGRAEIGNIGDDDFQFKVSTDGAAFYEALRLSVTSSAGLVTLTGGRLKFPNTQIASSDPNTLDDYEEGSWTPGLTFGGGATSMTGAFAGAYTTIGNLVVAIGIIALTAKGSSTGSALVTGLPFTVKSSYNGGLLTTFYSGMAGLSVATTPPAPLPIIGYCTNGATTASMNLPTATGVTSLTDANFTNASNFQFVATYLR
jgi:hypothetical protein